MFIFDRNFVIQFADGTFLHKGTFHGFVLQDGMIKMEKTNDLKEARLLHNEDSHFQVAREMSIKEEYTVKEIEIAFKLKED